MRFRVTQSFLIFTILALAGCGGSSSTSRSSLTTNSSSRAYSGTASVGDFLSITLDATAQTITYTNVSNGDSGTVPYTVNSDGTYTLSDPKGNLIAAFEVPNYALLIQAAKTGPNHDALALVTAVAQAPISLTSMANQNFNYMQFRTAAGGVEVGSVSIDGQDNISNNSYWPYGSVSSQSPFHSGVFPGSSLSQDPSGNFLKMSDGSGTYDYVFGTANGIFAVDSPNGAILGLKKATSKAFDPTFAGTYKAIFYQKTGAATGAGNVETGTPSLGNATITVGSAGQVTVTDGSGKTLVQATLTPFADASYLHGVGEVTDPCNGVFTFRVTTASSQQDVFVTFMGQAMLFSSFSADLPWGSGNTYNYLYGVGLK